jgi:Uma2 family endonuclease
MPTPTLSLALQPGEIVTLQPIDWSRFEAVLVELGEKRSARVAYANGVLEIMTPLPEHERAKVTMGDLVKTLLRLQKRRWESLGSTTFKRQEMAAGIEPDDCFYIQNCEAVIGKERLDLSVDPPPDLAIESDMTSRTELEAYAALRVPELWIYAKGKFSINIWQTDKYIESAVSLAFPGVAIAQLIPQFVQRSKQVGSSQALDEFEQAIGT